MAGEIKGKIYEAITAIALALALQKLGKRSKVFWHEQPEWISIEPDLAVGTSKNTIDSLLLVTHSGAEKLSEKKFWRNIGELFQWKVHGPKPVRCYGVLFESSVKKKLQVVESAVLDGHLDVSKTGYGRALMKHVQRHSDAYGNTDDKRRLYVEALCDRTGSKYDPRVAACIDEFATALANLMETENRGTRPLWRLLRKGDTLVESGPMSRLTYVRNGIAKLMLFDATTREQVYPAVAEERQLGDDKVPSYAVELGLVIEDIAGYRIDDSEVISAIKTLGKERCAAVIAAAPARMDDFIDPLRSVGNIDVFAQFVVDHFNELKTAAGMKRWLLRCYDDPLGILPAGASLDVPPRDTWLFPFCMTLEKARQGKILAYGLSNLAKESGVSDVELRFAMPRFISREERPDASTILRVAGALAEKLLEVGSTELRSPEFLAKMKAMLIQRQMYVLRTYRNFDPLLELIKLSLSNIGIDTKEVTLPSCVAEFAGTTAASSKYLRVASDTLVYWQSVTEAGRIHKTKELSARFRATKIHWDGTRFVPRPSAKRLFLVVDGEWRDDDLKMLMRSGVDEVFYPDDIDRLAARVAAFVTPAAPKEIPIPAEPGLAVAAEPVKKPGRGLKRKKGK